MENKDFAERNVGLVRALVPRFLGRGIEYDDLFQAGCEGLIKAAAHFDPDRGYKFSTYAVPVILGEMRRLFREGVLRECHRWERQGVVNLAYYAMLLSDYNFLKNTRTVLAGAETTSQQQTTQTEE